MGFLDKVKAGADQATRSGQQAVQQGRGGYGEVPPRQRVGDADAGSTPPLPSRSF